jgi:outer membrane lipoprotein LolB
MSSFLKITLYIFLIFTTISGCSLLPDKTTKLPSKQALNQNIEQRNQALLALKKWKISGKIAFIQGKKRQSASLYWQYDKNQQQQKLNLTTFLGINVFQLVSDRGLHTVEVDGDTFEDTDLQNLVFSLTGMSLPADALVFWLKGLAYQPNDIINYDQQSHLPINLTSQYNNDTWQVNYDHYQIINDYRLATKLTLKKNNLIIKIAIKKWQL